MDPEDDDPPPREVELKLSLQPADVARLQRHPLVRALTQSRPRAQSLRSVYFDTRELDLAREGLSLRVREVGRAYVQTLKSRNRGGPGTGLFDRSELEAPVLGEEPDLERIPDLAVRERLQRELAAKPLQPLFVTEMRRSRRVLREDDTEIRFDLDVGEVRAGDARDPICELELELVQGDPASLYVLALELLEDVALRPAGASKAERGYALVTGERPRPRRAARVDLARGASVEEVILALVESCIRQIGANEVPAYEGNDPEGVHQMRVGVRRTRALLSLFRRMLGDPRTAELRAELRWLGRALGPARDLDVFLEELIEPVFRRYPDDPGLKRLRDEALLTREESYSQARAAIQSPRYARLMLRLGLWASQRAWRAQPLTEQSARLFAPAAPQIERLLARRHRKAVRLGHDVAQRSIEERHALRIQLKKLRYASEFVRSLYPARKTDRYIARLAKLQNVLGHLNDVATAERLTGLLLSHLGSEASPMHQRAAGFVTGWAAHAADRAIRRLEKRWARFEDTPRFWRG